MKRVPRSLVVAAPILLALVMGALHAGTPASIAAPPSPASIVASGDSIMATARALSGETGIGPPSRFGPLPTTALYARYLLARLDAALEPFGGYAYADSFDPAFEYNGPHTLRSPYTNIVGVLPGRLGAAAPGYFLLGAHFDGTSMREVAVDTTWDPFTAPAPGADDNASGVSTILEALRVAAARGLRPEADVHIAFFDGEELQLVESGRSLLGSNALADSAKALEDAGGPRLYAVLNADMVAYNPRGDTLVVITNTISRWLATQIVDAHERAGAAPGLQVNRLVKGLANSDHAPFWLKGYDAVMLIEASDVEKSQPHYHRVTDTVDNTYSRGGSQAALTADLMVGMISEWSRTGPDSLVVTDEDIFVQAGRAVDLPSVDVDDEVTVAVGVTNRGGTLTTPWSVTLDVETLDGAFVRTLGTRQITTTTPAGAREKLHFAWTPGVEERGVVRLTARIAGGTGPATEGSRLEAVRGGDREVQAAFVYPNPTRDPESAMLAYELTEDGSVRLTVIGVDGVPIAEHDIAFDRALPPEGTTAGLTRLPLRDVLGGEPLAPGLYLVRVEVFSPEGGSTNVAVSKFAVLR